MASGATGSNWRKQARTASGTAFSGSVLVSETGRANYTGKPIRRVHLSKFSSKIIMGKKRRAKDLLLSGAAKGLTTCTHMDDGHSFHSTPNFTDPSFISFMLRLLNLPLE